MANTAYIGEVFDENSFAEKLQLLRNSYEHLDKNKIRAWQEAHLSAKKWRNNICDLMKRQWSECYEYIF